VSEEMGSQKLGAGGESQRLNVTVTCVLTLTSFIDLYQHFGGTCDLQVPLKTGIYLQNYITS